MVNIPASNPNNLTFNIDQEVIYNDRIYIITSITDDKAEIFAPAGGVNTYDDAIGVSAEDLRLRYKATIGAKSVRKLPSEPARTERRVTLPEDTRTVALSELKIRK